MTIYVVIEEFEEDCPEVKLFNTMLAAQRFIKEKIGSYILERDLTDEDDTIEFKAIETDEDGNYNYISMVHYGKLKSWIYLDEKKIEN